MIKLVSYIVGCERCKITTGYFMFTVLTKTDLKNLVLLQKKNCINNHICKQKKLQRHV